MSSKENHLAISLMLGVPDGPKAVEWYQRALGAKVLWDLGSVAGLEIQGAPFFIGEPSLSRWSSPNDIGTTTLRVEVFCDDPDEFIRAAVSAGADPQPYPMQDRQVPWGIHHQGGFVDPFGHIWFVGDRTPLQPHA